MLYTFNLNEELIHQAANDIWEALDLLKKKRLAVPNAVRRSEGDPTYRTILDTQKLELSQRKSCIFKKSLNYHPKPEHGQDVRDWATDWNVTEAEALDRIAHEGYYHTGYSMHATKLYISPAQEARNRDIKLNVGWPEHFRPAVLDFGRLNSPSVVGGFMPATEVIARALSAAEEIRTPTGEPVTVKRIPITIDGYGPVTLLFDQEGNRASFDNGDTWAHLTPEENKTTDRTLFIQRQYDLGDGLVCDVQIKRYSIDSDSRKHIVQICAWLPADIERPGILDRRLVFGPHIKFFGDPLNSNWGFVDGIRRRTIVPVNGDNWVDAFDKAEAQANAQASILRRRLAE